MTSHIVDVMQANATISLCNIRLVADERECDQGREENAGNAIGMHMSWYVVSSESSSRHVVHPLVDSSDRR